MVSHIKRRTSVDGVWEQLTEERIFESVGGSNERLEKTT
jgi:hypothetical protein